MTSSSGLISFTVDLGFARGIDSGIFASFSWVCISGSTSLLNWGQENEKDWIEIPVTFINPNLLEIRIDPKISLLKLSVIEDSL
ncbi:hypothetical protein LEP1GSC036_1157 [Leptospira weilii str. 2006001853]|uniref:Uncharacterized protein n=3 Tax=Leptospira weilii TaxID=28184 RepID=A0A828Z2Y8_9LEPT|nr:hypothetical protein LEP1GSC036_1157 [Leptospira weilii str. 2006001853]EMJ64717.1 hypothetical protein LEP1GSC051_3286 [Leptospira sp. P2653]EMM70502.1 hypothetical protein LEP1GSC038_1237 [Leptospira weilii str. 2006001855]EMN44884.1 hypothetical protein LEP1GSC086_0243 [Leptospira weilii str. LNT 1234]EMY13876.1 hypothetical protein LEP1GSC043_3299 [Leptospira weilii str. Ecochallenge]